MDSSRFVLGIGIRTAAIGGIAFAVIQLVAAQRLYASALVLTAIGALVLLDLRRHITSADRLLGRFVDSLATQDFERPANLEQTARGFPNLVGAVDRALTKAAAARAERHRQLDLMQTLLDTVSVSLFLIDETGIATPVNRAARKLAGRPIRRLEEMPLLGEALAQSVLDIPPGQRAVLRLANGQRALATTASFTAAGKSMRLVSLQNIEGELDAVEIKAWQDLVRILAHEIMNSLTPIASLAESASPLLKQLSSTQSVRDEKTIADVSDAVDAIARRSAGLMSFVQRYRQVAELPRPVLRQLTASQLLTRIEQLMASTLPEKKIRLTRAVEPRDLTLTADPELLEQALINLLHNAIDAVAQTEDAHIHIDCRISDEQVAISVADNGRGLDPATVDRIFVPFFSTKPGGSGIGLSLARQIARAHHGRLEAKHNEPRGAVFTLVIPSGGALVSLPNQNAASNRTSPETAS